MKTIFCSLIAAVLGMAGAPKLKPGDPALPAKPAAVATAPAKVAEPTLREKLIAAAVGQVGTQEKSGNNDGPVDKYLVAVGLGGTRNPYCAAFVYWAGKTALAAKNPFPKSAWSPDFVGTGATAKIETAKPGDTFGIYFASKGRVAHTGLVRGWQGRYLWTVEANTSPGQSSGEADRNGDGVWSKLRDPRTIHRVKSWLP